MAKLPLLLNSTASLCFKPRLHSLLLPVWAPPTPSILLPEISLQNTSEAIPVTQTVHGSRCPEGISLLLPCLWALPSLVSICLNLPVGLRARARTRSPSLLRGSQAPRRAVCGTRGSLRTMHGGGSAPSCPRSSGGKASACNAGDLGSVPGLGRAPGGQLRPLRELQETRVATREESGSFASPRGEA